LKGNFGDELRKDIAEGRDYVLLPQGVAEMLFTRYTGGPKFPREAINVGSPYSPLIQVNLFPVRFEIYHCDKSQPNPSKDLKTHFLIRYYTKNMLMERVIDDAKGKLNLDYWSSLRCWVKETRTTSLSSSSISNSTDGNNDEEDTISAKRQRIGRMLTADLVEWDGDWRYVRSLNNKSVTDVLGTKEHVEIIIETVSGRSSVKDFEWPRFSLLEAWKADLRKGDLIDAMDRSKNWYEAVVKEIDTTGKLHVHFKGWGEDFDEVILADQKSTRIKPLHEETDDRTLWEEGNSVELKISSGTPNYWLPVTIVSRDIRNDRIQVKYSAKEKQDALHKSKKNQGKQSTVSSPGTGGATDDDLLKKRRASTDDDLTDRISESKNEDAMDEVKVDGNEIIKEWHELYSDDICPMFTHTAKKSTTYQYGSSTPYTTTYSSPTYSGGYNRNRYDYDKNTRGSPAANGVVGLQNLGNTCFMNSILQCLSNTQALTEFFLNENYKDQINYDNPLGNNGKVALSYGKLVKEIWSNSYTLVIPRDFKNTIGEFRPQFAGYEQQDSQEFMNFLLDGLHEDLNRIHKKPHVQKIESKGRDDTIISAESWRRFLLRNDSKLVDQFFGQLKSHVTCVNCRNVSVTFDEYSSLSLPIPIKNTKSIEIVVQLLPLGTPPLKLKIEVEVTEPMSSLKKILIEKLTSLGISLLEGTSSLSGTGNGLPSSSSPETTTTATENGFEMVKTPETEEDGEFQVVNKQSASEPMEVDANLSKKSTASIVNNYDKIYFHFAVTFISRPSIFKNYNSEENSGVAISSYIGRTDSLIAFQLEHPAPELKPFSSYSYGGNYHHSSSSLTQKENEKKVQNPYYTFDLVQGQTIGYNNSDRVEAFGYPTRIALDRSKENFSNHDLHLMVRQFVRRCISDEVADQTSWPYDLIVTTSYGGHAKRTIGDDMNPFEHPGENTSNDTLMVCWQKQAMEGNFLNMDEVKLIRDLDPSHHSPDRKLQKMGISSVYDDDDDAASSKDGKRISIYDCLDKFIEREQLNETETLYCSKCKQHLAPIKKMDVYSAPDMLIIHLKRFQFIPGQYFVHREKINELIDFPIEGLDLTKYVIGSKSGEIPPIYDLYGVSHHMGGLGGGHYIATCKNSVDGKW
jgi:ubiquitin C-terminal hydrolase